MFSWARLICGSGFCRQSHLVEAQPTEHIQHVHDALVLRLTVAFDHHREIRNLRFQLGQALLQFRQRNRHGIQKYLTFVVDRDGLSLRFGKTRRSTGLGQINLHTLDRGRAHQDENNEQHIRQIEHRRDVDVVVGFVFALDLHGSGCDYSR